MIEQEFKTSVKYGMTLYIDGIWPIRVLDVSADPNSEYYATVMWYDDNECAHRTHYDHLEFEMSEFEVELDKIARLTFPVSYEDRENFKMGYRAGYEKAKKENEKIDE